jgi:TonB family protein
MTRQRTIILSSLWILLTLSRAFAQSAAPNITLGSLSEIKGLPNVYLNIRDEKKLDEVLIEIYKDPRGQLAPVYSADQADFQIAFVNQPQSGSGSAKFDPNRIEPNWIGGDHRGRMIVYGRSKDGNLRIVWVDEKGEKDPVKAIRNFLKALSKVKRQEGDLTGRSSQLKLSAQTGATQPGRIEPMSMVLKPTILYRERATYTDQARNEKVNGVVVLAVVFGADGKIQNIRVIRGLPYGLTDNAIQAALRIRFKPAMKNGQPVSVRGVLEFSFSLY